VVSAAIDDLARRLSHWLQRHHQAHADLPGRTLDGVLGWLTRWCGRDAARGLLDRFLKQGTIAQLGQFVCLPAFAPALSAADEKHLTAMLSEIKQGGFQPPLLDALSMASKGDKKRWERLATLAVALGELVLIEPKMYLHAETEKRLRTEVAGLIRARGPQTVAEIREMLQSSRKYVVPFVEYLDRIGFTRRVGDRRELVT
jgi:selenocysteine-specific elongation factor